MKIYNYNNITGEYLFESDARISPLDGLPLIPAGATSIKPPETSEKKAIIFNGNSWDLVDDFRGEIWYEKGTRKKIIINFLGQIDKNLYQKDPEPYTTEEKWENIRKDRNELLRLCDWTQLADSPVDKTKWLLYRKALRDIPQNFETPESVIWPLSP